MRCTQCSRSEALFQSPSLFEVEHVNAPENGIYRHATHTIPSAFRSLVGCFSMCLSSAACKESCTRLRAASAPPCIASQLSYSPHAPSRKQPSRRRSCWDTTKRICLSWQSRSKEEECSASCGLQPSMRLCLDAIMDVMRTGMQALRHRTKDQAKSQLSSPISNSRPITTRSFRSTQTLIVVY